MTLFATCLAASKGINTSDRLEIKHLFNTAREFGFRSQQAVSGQHMMQLTFVTLKCDAGVCRLRAAVEPSRLD